MLIFKKGSKVKVNVLCLTALIKLLGSIVKDALLSYLYQHNLLSHKQHGFIPHRLCCTQLFYALNDWTSALDQGLSTNITYCDFSKTFDSVPHSRILSKLKGYGLDGKLLEWFKRFLVRRCQCIYVNESLSSWTSVRSGESHRDLFLALCCLHCLWMNCHLWFLIRWSTISMDYWMASFLHKDVARNLVQVKDYLHLIHHIKRINIITTETFSTQVLGVNVPSMPKDGIDFYQPTHCYYINLQWRSISIKVLLTKRSVYLALLSDEELKLSGDNKRFTNSILTALQKNCSCFG